MPRKATWLVIVWTALMGLWAMTVPGSVGQACADVSSASRSACELAATLGGAATLVVLVVVWLIGFLVTVMVWRMTRPQRRAAASHPTMPGPPAGPPP